MKLYKNHSDTALVVLLKGGDEGAFTEIYRRYWKVLIDTAYRRLKDKEECQEIVQQLMVSLFLRRKDLDPELSLAAFFHSALKKRILNYFRHIITRERYAIIIQARKESGPPEIEASIENDELTARLRKATEKLPPRCKEVFILSKVDYLSHAEIAKKLNISVSTVEKHLARGMELMRKNLGNTDSSFIFLAAILVRFTV